VESIEDIFVVKVSFITCVCLMIIIENNRYIKANRTAKALIKSPIKSSDDDDVSNVTKFSIIAY